MRYALLLTTPVIAAALIALGCTGDPQANDTAVGIEEQQLSEQVAALMEQIDAGERNPEVLLSLRVEAEREGTQYAVVDFLEQLAQRKPRDLVVARELYLANMETQNLTGAVNAIDGLRKAACSAVSDCEHDTPETLYIQAMSLLLSARTFDVLRGSELEPEELYQHLETDLKAAIELSDRIGGRFEPPADAKYIYGNGEPAALLARQFFLGLLLHVGREAEWLSGVREFFVLCDEYDRPGICYRCADYVDRYLRDKKVSWHEAGLRELGFGSFDSTRWKSGDQRVRGEMVSDLLWSRYLYWKAIDDVTSVLGEPDRTSGGGDELYYYITMESLTQEEREPLIRAVAERWGHVLVVKFGTHDAGVATVERVGLDLRASDPANLEPTNGAERQ